MRILIISPSLDPLKNVSGISSAVNNILKFGGNQYFHFELGSSDANKDENTFKKTLRLVSAFFSYILFLKKVNPDIVHMNVPTDRNGILREFAILRINKLFRKKIIVHLHGGEFLMKVPQSRMLTYMFKKILSKADKVLALSEIERQGLSDLYNFDEAEVLYNGVDTDLRYKVVDKEKGDKINILFLGRIHETKGVLDMIKVFDQLYREKSFKFILCGTGSLVEYAVDSLSSLMKDDFVYKGIVSGEDKHTAIYESDIFLLPSHFEGLPMSLLEVMAVGVVPVITNVGSVTDVVCDGENGIIIEKSNPENIYIKLKSLLENPEQMKGLSINARKTVEERYDVRHMVAKLEDIYSLI